MRISLLVRLTLAAAAAFVAVDQRAENAPAATAVSSANVSSAIQPWRDATQSAAWRTDRLLAAMSLEQKIALAMADAPQDFASFAPLGIPPLTRVDASSGLRGDKGVTAFPVPLALAASFDIELAAEYGRAIAQEARLKGWNVILGPTVDIARDGLTGRLTEGFGEEPLLSGAIGSSVAGAMQSQNVIVMAKHLTVYQSETDRLIMNVAVSKRALHEVYNVSFDALIEKANVGALMGSYPKINGIYACENRESLDYVKNNPAFHGYVATDFAAGADAVAQFNAGIDSWALEPMRRVPEAFRDGRILRERLDDATRRVLMSMFEHGVFDHPLPPAIAAVVTTPERQAVALHAAEAGTVLLKNAEGLLPLSRNASVALIGPAGRDVVTGVQGSSYVNPGQFVTPIDAISQAVGNSATVTVSQGSLGDASLPLLAAVENPFGPSTKLTAPNGDPGWQAEFFASVDYSGAPISGGVVTAINLPAKPIKSLPAQWSARWTATLTPVTSGLVRFSALCSGTIKVIVDGKPVIESHRATALFFPEQGGPNAYTLQGVVQLTAGQPVNLRVEYSTVGSVWSQGMQLGWQPQSLIPAAVLAAKQADVAVVFVNQTSGEEMDRDNFTLPGDQDALIEAVSLANPNTIVVLNTPGAVKMPWLNHVKSILQVWYPGSSAGTSLARVLYGEAEPGGRLPITFPADETQGPTRYKTGTVSYDEGVFVGYRYFQLHQQKPLFPFGHGLSYTTFALDQLTTSGLTAAKDDGKAAVSVRVRNSGKRAGSTVVQVYAGTLPTTVVATPARKLVGFAKVHLSAGEEETVRIEIDRRSLSYWDEALARWVTPTGVVPIYIGYSSENIVLNGEMPVR